MRKSGTGGVPLLIKRIELENVKSYRRASVNLSTGVNAITGENGAGKTTILEAVGFALFDYLPYNQNQFLRHGAKRGSVTVEIIGKDDRNYRVVRQFGSSPKYYVEDVELRKKIAEGKEDVTRWLREQMEISASLKLDLLFKEVVGVPQGNFTSIFLGRRSERAPIFEALFGIEDYRKAAEKMNEVLRRIEREISESREKLGELRGRVTNYEERRREREEYKKRIAKLREEEKSIRKELESIQKLIEEFEELKRRIDDLRREIETRGQLRLRLLRSLEERQRECDELRRRRAEIEALKDAYEEFEKLQKEVEELREVLREKEKLEQEFLSKKEMLRGIKGEIERIKKEIAEIEDDKRRLAEIEEAVKDLESLERELENLSEKEERRRFAERRLRELEEEVRRRERKIEQLEDALSNLDEVQKKVKILENARDELKRVSEELKGVEENLRYLDELKEFISLGICPFIQESCSRVSGKVVEEREEILRRRREELMRELQTIEERIRDLERYEKELEDLRKIEREREILIKDVLNAQSEMEGLKKEAERSFEEELKRLRKKVEDLRSQKSLLEEIRKRIKKEGELRGVLKERERKRVELSERLREIEKEISDLEALRSEIILKLERMNELKEAHENYLRLPEIIERIQNLERELGELQEEIQRIEREESSLKENLRELEESYDEGEHRKLRMRAEDLSKALGDLRGRMETTEEILERLEEELRFYEECMKQMRRLEENLKEWERRAEDVKRIKEILRDAIPLITEAHVSRVSEEARKIYSEIMGDGTQVLSWESDFGIRVRRGTEEREFPQMSGGEQMSAALAVRLALLKHLSTVDFAFFDEPTQNMDENRRGNFANFISNFTGIKQLAVISHDDTFESLVHHALRVEKTPEGSKIT